MSRYSITIELDAASAEEAVALVAVGNIVELLNLDLLMLMHPPGSARFGGDIKEETFYIENQEFRWWLFGGDIKEETGVEEDVRK